MAARVISRSPNDRMLPVTSMERQYSFIESHRHSIREQRMTSDADDSFMYPSTESHGVAYRIGRVCIAWSSLGVLVSAALSFFLELKDANKNYVVAGAHRSEEEIELCKHFSFMVDSPETLQRLSTVLTFADNDLRKKRNHCVHTHYVFQPDKSERATYKPRLRKVQSRTWDLEYLQESQITSGEITQVASAISQCERFMASFVMVKLSLHNERREGMLGLRPK
jgi:hypothetical protein